LDTNGRFTAYSGGHCCWGNFYDPTYTEVINGQTVNIYEWMLLHNRVSLIDLPLFFSYFTAIVQDNSVVLDWQVEIPVDECIVQESTDGVNFQNVAVIPANSSNTYTYTE